MDTLFISMSSYITTGIILGFSAGFTPGPLLTLVITETISCDLKAGIKVALAPILTDLPIILFALLILKQLDKFQFILGGISFAGAILLFCMGIENIRSTNFDVRQLTKTHKHFTKAVLVNIFSPHPYMFWISIGGPFLMKAMNQSVYTAVVFAGSFYLLFIGAKILVAVLVARSKSFFSGKPYIFLMRCMGLTLCVFSLLLVRDGLLFIGIFPF